MRVVSVLVTLALMGFLLANIEWPVFLEIMGRISLLAFGGALLVYFLLNVFRALRFRALLDRPDTPLRVLLPITLYHNFLVRVLPFKLGEFSYVVLLRTHLRYSLESGFSSLVGARLMELLLIVIVCAAGLLMSGDIFGADTPVLTAVLLVSFVVCLLGMYFAGRLVRLGTGLLFSGLRRVIAQPPALVGKLEAHLYDLAGQLDLMRQPRLFFAALFFTMFTYTCSFGTNYILMRAVGVDVELGIMIAIISVGMFASAFPFSISGFGVVELSWAFALVTLAGYSLGEATSVGLLLHGFQIIAASLWGLVGYLLIRGFAPPPGESAVRQPVPENTPTPETVEG